MRCNVVMLLGLAAALAAGQVLGQPVGRWDRFETSVTNTRSYANPFTGTTLSATFTSPSERQVNVEGFHDGGQTWRLRFMPDEIGAWTYTAAFSDGAPGVSGGFDCVDTGLHGPLQVNPVNRLWFEHTDGTPFYLCAFHLWFVCRLDSRGVLLSTLDWLKSQGFNAVVGPHVVEPETPLPWPRTGGTVDFSRFNLIEWQRLDKVLSEMASRGMVLIPFSIMGGTNGVPKIDTSANRDLFLRYWVARWGGFWNATFQPTSEWEEGYGESEMLQIMNRIRELDGGRHLVSTHSVEASTTTIKQAAAYTYHTVQNKLSEFNPTKYTTLVSLYNTAPKPILAHECLWEGNLYQTEAGLDMDNMRKGAWVIALSGGQINYADEVIPPRKYQTREVLGPQFSQLGTEMAPYGWLYPYLAVLGGFIRSMPFGNMTLQPALSSTGMCLADSGTRYLTYAPSGGTVTLNLTAASGDFQARWLNPRTGGLGAPTSLIGGASRQFTAPDTSDWALYVEKADSVDATPPGAVLDLAAAGGFLQNTLTWRTPTDADFTGTTIRVSTTAYPAGPTDGDPVADVPGPPDWTGTAVHGGLTRGVRYYYSAFAYDWMFNHASVAAHATMVPFGPGDVDLDYDVDQSDFGEYQRCLSGEGRPTTAGCEFADLDADGDADVDDMNVFLTCMAGPGGQPGC